MFWKITDEYNAFEKLQASKIDTQKFSKNALENKMFWNQVHHMKYFR